MKSKLLSLFIILTPILSIAQIKVGAECTTDYYPLLKNKRIAVVGNHTSLIGTTHLVDSLLSAQFNVVKIFSPEHGFRGNADAGAKVDDNTDSITGLPVISLYGKNYKPKPEMLANVDLVIFDIQDVGVRFYTYISTMHYMMQACAENGKQLIVLDRPNPNGFYVDGPVLDSSVASFVGVHRLPIVHGLTVGELALMINGEDWIGENSCDLTIIACDGYNHSMEYELPVKPSPNLGTMHAIYCYPTLCLFEGTNVSVGRGTDNPFSVAGSPYHTNLPYTFIPRSIEGASMNPKHKGKECVGFNFKTDTAYFQNLNLLDVQIWLDMYNLSTNKAEFFNNFFKNLAGTRELQKQIEEGKTADEIRASWQNGLQEYKALRQKYLIYGD